MTSLEKAINLRYIFLTFKLKKKNHQYMHLFLLHVLVFFNFFQKSLFDPNTCTIKRAPIMGTVDVH